MEETPLTLTAAGHVAELLIDGSACEVRVPYGGRRTRRELKIAAGTVRHA